MPVSIDSPRGFRHVGGMNNFWTLDTAWAAGRLQTDARVVLHTAHVRPQMRLAADNQKIRHGAIDVCPTCKGLWMGATELDQIQASTQNTGPLYSFLKILGK